MNDNDIVEINAAHRACEAVDGSIREAVIAKINAIRKVGLMLATKREACANPPEGQPKIKWLSLFRPAEGEEFQPRFEFSDETARRYIALAESLPEEITSLPQGIASLTAYMRAMKALPPSTRGSGTRGASDPFDSFIKGVMTITHAVSSWKDDAPVDEWPEDLRGRAIEQLRPLHELFEELSALEAERL